jgi:hypothetical protein
MTICIAAICNDGKSMVVCADRMFTNPGLSVEFETTEQKIELIGPRSVLMAAGNSVNATEVIESVRPRLSGNQNAKITALAEIVRSEYATVRNKSAYEGVISPILGADFEKFRAQGTPLPTYMEKQQVAFQNLTMMCHQQNLGTDLLLAGIDSSGAHLFHIANPGVCAQLDKLGYAAIGSGGIHAMIRLSLSGQSRSRPLLETLADVYNAKRSAEVAPGVGEATDIAVIETSICFCSPEVMGELKKLHDTNSTIPKMVLVDLKAKYDAKQKAN